MSKRDSDKTASFGTKEYREYFRTTYVEKDGKERFLGITNGNVYRCIVFSVLITIPILLAYQITEYKYYYILLLPLYFLICNFLEYLLHRFPMHHEMKGAEFLYEHLTVHHSFFYDDYYYYEQPRDYMAVFLPLLYLSFVSAIFFIMSLIVYFIADLDNAIFFATVGYSYYLMYETLHFSYHAKQDSFLKKIPYMDQLGHFHLLHHQTKLMSNFNFNITFPIFDKVFNTLYKED